MLVPLHTQKRASCPNCREFLARSPRYIQLTIIFGVGSPLAAINQAPRVVLAANIGRFGHLSMETLAPATFCPGRASQKRRTLDVERLNKLRIILDELKA